MLDDIAWLAKVHGERIEKKTVSNALFADSMCEVSMNAMECGEDAKHHGDNLDCVCIPGNKILHQVC
jgi:hypothetical protein